ncbi:hypothetical protein BDV96DRAFT_693850 [Lophiotrema nucula]|uniref:Zn(2)-C6 fungal-type domain-containing protein n=1 Tax=Lophiotrema nucula TaxID=690887 RepID=A0A6A5YJQ2_9PLEO|nr:hypothetical protein BDV96DRAFT_693850 [Lophiotrema nucula]
MPSVYQLPRTKACQACFDSKTKCEPDAGYAKCRRCNRNGSDCILREKPARKKRKTSASRQDGHDTDSTGVESQEGASRSPLDGLPIDQFYDRLRIYETTMAHYFPFVMIPPEAYSGDQFFREKPFLSLVIAMLGCCHDRVGQRKLAMECRKYLAIHTVQEGEKSLDLLQGLLVLTNWYHLQFELLYNRTMFLHLAMALVVDLELNKSPFCRGHIMKASDVANGYERSFEGVSEHTLEQRRAFLGCVYLTSVVSKCLVNMDAIQFSDYAKQCCDALETSPLDSDHNIVHMFRLQQVVERSETARSALTKRNPPTAELGLDLTDLTVQPRGNVFVSYWSDVMDRYWESVPSSAKTDLLLVQFNYAKICLHEVGLDDAQFATNAFRCEVLHNCSDMVRMFHETFVPMSMQRHIIFNLPSHLFAQSNHAMFVAIQLCSVQCEGWSAEVSERKMALMLLMDKTLNILDDILHPKDGDPIQAPAFFNRLAPMARAIKKWYETRMRTLNEESLAGCRDEDVVQSDPTDFEFLSQFFDFDDSVWLQNILAVDDGHVATSSPVI